MIKVIGEALAKSLGARILEFSTLGTRNWSARSARNPATVDNVSVSASTGPVFKDGTVLKNLVGGGGRRVGACAGTADKRCQR